MLVACCAVFLALLAWTYGGTSGPGAVDTAITDALADHVAGHSFAARAAVQVGAEGSVIAMSCVLVVTCLALRRTALAVVAIAGPGVTGVLTTVMKPALGRTLEGVPAFPSGHTAGITAIALVVALLVTGLFRRPSVTVTILAGVGVVLAATTVATGLVIERFHYPTDTLGGFCVAVVVVLGLALLVERVRPIARRRTAAVHDGRAG